MFVDTYKGYYNYYSLLHIQCHMIDYTTYNIISNAHNDINNNYFLIFKIHPKLHGHPFNASDLAGGTISTVCMVQS